MQLKTERTARSLVIVCTAVFVSGCGTLPNGRGWGQDATLLPGWARVRQAATRAVRAPGTWIPAASALVLQADDMDEELSKSAIKSTPIFGSNDNADDQSEVFRNLALTTCLVTGILTPSGESSSPWTSAKCQGFLIGAIAMQTTPLITTLLKEEMPKTRPNGVDDRSFPSRHAAQTAVYAGLTSRNIGAMPLPGPVKTVLQTGTIGLTAGCAWARVESGDHYPSDALAGMALGNFLAAFINDAFLGLDIYDPYGIIVTPAGEHMMVGIQWPF